MSSLTDKLKGLLEECERATPGPYVLAEYHIGWVHVWPSIGPNKSKLHPRIADNVKKSDADFIASARTNLPAALRATMIAIESLSVCSEASHEPGCLPKECDCSVAAATQALAAIEKEFS